MSRAVRWSSREDMVLIETIVEYIQLGDITRECFKEVSKRLNVLGYRRSHHAAYQHWKRDLEEIYGEELKQEFASKQVVLPTSIADFPPAKFPLIPIIPEELTWRESFQLIQQSMKETWRDSMILLVELFTQVEEENRSLKKELDELKQKQTHHEISREKINLLLELEEKLKEVANR